MPADNHSPLPQEALASRVNELYHDFQAKEFDHLHRLRHRIERSFWRLEVVPRLKAARLRQGLDLCTGTGFVPRVLLEQLDHTARIICVDLSEGALQQTRSFLSEFADRITTRAGDVQALPLPDASVDWVTLNAGLHHIPRPEDTLREIDRVLKPGGYFCLGYEPNAAFASCRMVSLLERAIWHLLWYFSISQNRRRLRQWLGRPAEAYEDSEHLSRINTTLAAEGLIRCPLSLEELRHLVDPHTHTNEARPAGFAPADLLGRCFPEYTLETLLVTDFGGEMLRKHPWWRRIYDGFLGALCPGKGRLFSWVIRKPTTAQSG